MALPAGRTPAPGSTRRRTGFPTREKAAERDHALALLKLASGDTQIAGQIATILTEVRTGQPLPARDGIAQRVRAGLTPAEAISTADYLWQWYRSRKIEATTLYGYEGYIRNYLAPHLGIIPIDELRVTHVQAMFDAIGERNPTIAAARASGDPHLRTTVKGERIVSHATLHRIRATLRKALNDAIRTHRLIEFNPAAHIELPSGRRPKAKVWTAAAVAEWRRTTTRPSEVMVWTPAQAGAFLDYAETHDIVLYPLFLLILHRGLRRGEAVGLRDADVDLDTGSITVSQQITTIGWTPVTKKVKSEAGERTVSLDATTLAGLRGYRARRARWQLVNGPAWPNTGLFFVQPDGTAYHSSITITGDTYTSVVHELDTERAKADAAAALVPRTSRRDHENPPPAALIQQALTARELLEPGQITLNGRGRPGHTGT